MASLVSNYKFGEKNKKEQYPEMEAILQREGWTIINVFINPNHGNEVTVYMKTFEDRNKPLDDDDE